MECLCDVFVVHCLGKPLLLDLQYLSLGQDKLQAIFEKR